MAMIDHHSSNQSDLFYTDCFARGSNIYIQGYKDGKRWRHTAKSYEPTLYVKAKKGEHSYMNALDSGEPLLAKRFDSMYEAKQFIEDHSGEVYGSTDWVGQYLYALFHDDIAYDLKKIRTAFIDIEVETRGGYSSVENAFQPILSITIGMGKRYYVLGLVDFVASEGRNDILYRKCSDERELLGCFLSLWKSLDPDVVSGYNINNYDLPYLVKRLGADADKLSPWKMMPEFIETVGKHGRKNLRPVIRGISCLDYYDLYTNGKFVQSEREEYTLEYISHYELGAHKTDYSEYGSLAKLYEHNPQKFIEYNIHDVELVEKLEDKLGFMNLVFTMAYDAKVNFVDTLGTVRIWENIARNHLQSRHLVALLKNGVESETGKIRGGYVKNPKPGIYKWAVSFDASSLYPSLIRQLNISPESLVGIKYPSVADEIGSEAWNHQLEMARSNNWTLTSNGAAFKRDSKGFAVELMEKYYQRKNDDSDLLVKLEKEYENKSSANLVDLKHKIELIKSRIFATKILLNSFYGALANPYFQFYDNRVAEAVTTSGQSLITYAASRINKWMSKTLNHESDYIIASDTDSVIVDCSGLVRGAMRAGILDPNASTNNIVLWLDGVCNRTMNPLLADIMQDVADKQNAMENAISMVREAICDAVLWTAAKNYVMRVCNNKGIMYNKPKYKIKGLEAIKSTTPTACRKALVDAIPFILDQDQKGLSTFIDDFSNKYSELPLQTISKNISMKISEKVVTQQMRAASVYNKLLVKNNLVGEYSLIENGSKMRLLKLKIPNPAGEGVIGFPNGILPSALDLESYIDYSSMFEQYFLVPLNKMVKVANMTVNTEPTLF